MAHLVPETRVVRVLANLDRVHHARAHRAGLVGEPMARDLMVLALEVLVLVLRVPVALALMVVALMVRALLVREQMAGEQMVLGLADRGRVDPGQVGLDPAGRGPEGHDRSDPVAAHGDRGRTGRAGATIDVANVRIVRIVVVIAPTDVETRGTGVDETTEIGVFRRVRYAPRNVSRRTRPNAAGRRCVLGVPAKSAKASNRLVSSERPRSGSTRVRCVTRLDRPSNEPVTRVARHVVGRASVLASWPPMLPLGSTTCSNRVERRV